MTPWCAPYSELTDGRMHLRSSEGVIQRRCPPKECLCKHAVCLSFTLTTLSALVVACGLVERIPWTGKSCFSNRVLVKAIFEASNAFKNSVFEASKLFPTKTLLLKHYYRRQGLTLCFPFSRIQAIASPKACCITPLAHPPTPRDM